MNIKLLKFLKSLIQSICNLMKCFFDKYSITNTFFDGMICWNKYSNFNDIVFLLKNH